MSEEDLIAAARELWWPHHPSRTRTDALADLDAGSIGAVTVELDDFVEIVRLTRAMVLEEAASLAENIISSDPNDYDTRDTDSYQDTADRIASLIRQRAAHPEPEPVETQPQRDADEDLPDYVPPKWQERAAMKAETQPEASRSPVSEEIEALAKEAEIYSRVHGVLVDSDRERMAKLAAGIRALTLSNTQPEAPPTPLSKDCTNVSRDYAG